LEASIYPLFLHCILLLEHGTLCLPSSLAPQAGDTDSNHD